MPFINQLVPTFYQLAPDFFFFITELPTRNPNLFFYSDQLAPTVTMLPSLHFHFTPSTEDTNLRDDQLAPQQIDIVFTNSP
jgi:hypothetical protein